MSEVIFRKLLAQYEDQIKQLQATLQRAADSNKSLYTAYTSLKEQYTKVLSELNQIKKQVRRADAN